MLKNSIITTCLLSLSLFLGCETQQIQEGMGILMEGMGKSGAISSMEVSSGLKEALVNGAKMAGGQLSKKDGFLKNEAVKILFPKEFQRVEKTLGDLGLSHLTNQAVVSFNRAAESAAQKSYPILARSITSMNFQDAMKILLGDGNEATEYLKRTTSDELQAAFLPVVRKSANEVSATRYWKDMAQTYNRIPLVNKIPEDISKYITQKTLAGLFYRVEKEEAEIRKNPMARSSQLLKRVFSYADSKK